MKVELYKIGVSDTPLYWSIQSEDCVLIMQFGYVNGAMQTKTEVVEVNQSGRDLEAQVALKLQSRVNKQVDKGYCYSIAEAVANKGLNSLNLIRPMLAKKIRDVKDIDFNNSLLQFKYNGHRCLITNIDGEYIAYSRNGKVITSIKHIVENLVIPEGHTVDGELYCHGVKLQTIGSWVKRDQEDTKKLSYIMYDTMLNVPYRLRQEAMYSYGRATDKISIAPTQDFSSDTPITEKLDLAISKGYEGLMLRQNKFGYDCGTRSKSLIKIKKHLDEEFLVIDIHQSKDDWAILECLVGSTAFRVSAPGTIDNKRNILYNRSQYIGKYINVEFFEWTADGKPFHPVATYWRE